MYTSDEFLRDLRPHVEFLEGEHTPDRSLKQAKQAMCAAGQAIVKAKEQLSPEVFWAVIDQCKLSHSDAWQYADYFKEHALFEMTYKPHLKKLEAHLEKTRLLNAELETSPASEEVKMLKLKASQTEFWALLQELDEVAPPRFGMPTNVERYQSMLSYMRDHPEEFSEHTEESSEESEESE